MRRASIHFVVDIAAFLVFLGLGVTGSMLRFVLPRCRGGGFRGGRAPEQAEELLSITRHQWADVHFFLATSFLGLVILHVILHWGWIKCYVKSLRKGT